MSKRILSLLLVLVMLIGCFTGCGIFGGNGNLWLWVIIVAGVIVIAGAIAIVFIVKQKKRKNICSVSYA